VSEAEPAAPGPLAPEDLRRSPNPLAGDYAMFGVGDRLLLSGHSHQAWPDVALEGVVEAFDDAARHADEKWERAFAKADELRAAVGALLGDPDAPVALGQNTHELVLRFLSALDLRTRPRLVTTDGEFHTIRRQLDRLAEDGRIEVVKVAAYPAATLAERLIGRGFELSIFDSFVKVSRLLGKNKEFIDREVPHLERLLALTPEDALADAQVIVVGHADPTTRSTIVSQSRGRRIVDLSGYVDLRTGAATEYEGICW